jgi:hypothetical protein
VAIVMAEGRSLQSSIDFVGELVKERCDAYLADKAKLPSWGSKVDQDVNIYLTALEQWVIGLLHWHFQTERYFNATTKEVAETRLVVLLSPKG